MRIERKTNPGLRRGIRVALAAALLTTAIAPAAHADWTKDVLDARCEDAQRDRMGQGLRDSVEASVRRAEATIQAPTPLGDLACLNDIMTLPLDTFSGIGSILGNLASGLVNSASGMISSLDFDVAGAICGMAAEKWATLTTGLGASALTFNDFKSMSANPAQRIAQNIKLDTQSISGQSSFTDSKGKGGTIAEWQKPSTEQSDLIASIPVFPEYVDPAIDLVAMQRAEDEAWTAKMAELSSYVGCRVAANLDGAQTGYYDNDSGWGNFRTYPNAADCRFDTVYTPVFVETDNGYQSVVPSGVHSVSPSPSGSGSGGSSAAPAAAAPASPAAAPAAAAPASVPAGTGFMNNSGGSSNPVWQSITQ